MLLILLIWLYTLIHAYLWGQGILLFFVKEISQEKGICTTFITAILTGLAAIATIGAIWSAFFPINPNFQFVLIAGSILSFSFFGKGFFLNQINNIRRLIKGTHPLVTCLGGLIFLLVWIKASCLSENNDEGGYYLPLIKWIEQFPLVPGIANIEDRMGYNSGFHLLSAVFGFSFLNGKGFYDLGSLYFLLQQLLSLRFLQSLLRSEELAFTNKWIYLTGATSALYINYITLSSPDTDLPANALSWILLLLFIEKIIQKRTQESGYFFYFLTIQAFFLITMRFSGVWLILLPVWLLWRNRSDEANKKRWLIFISIGALILLPWCYRNYKISGYLVYPLYQFDLFDPDWKVPIAKAKENYFYVRDYARRVASVRTYNPNRTDDIIQWLPQTFAKKTLIGKFFIAFVIGLSIAGIASFLFRWRWWRSQPDYLFLAVFFIINLLWWLYAFPDIRLAQAQLSIAVVAIPAYFIVKMSFIRKYHYSKIIGMLILLIWCAHAVAIVRSPAIATCGFIKPAPPFLSDATPSTLQGRPIQRTGRFSCGCATPPCLNPKTDPGITFRGTKVSDGFRVIKE